MPFFKVYFRKYAVGSLTNTNQNPVFPSLCLVTLNAHISVLNSTIIFRQYSIRRNRWKMPEKMQESAFVEKTITNDVNRGIQSLSHSFQNGARQIKSPIGLTAFAGTRLKKTPLTLRPYVKERAENGPSIYKFSYKLCIR